MSDYPTSITPTEVRGLREVCEVNGRHFARKRGTQQWTEYKPDNETAPPTETDRSPLYLSLVREEQALDGEPLHWSLFVARENASGMLYQVKGDAEYMTYLPSMDPIDIVNSESFLDSYQLAILTEQQAMLVRQIAENESPPRAENRASAKENCQGWCVRVITKLVEGNVVPAAKIQMAESMMQPV